MRSLTLTKPLTTRLLAGHPWIYRGALAGGAAAPGEIVAVRDRAGAEVARGFYDPDGPIAVRVLARGGDPVDVPRALARACGLRAAARARIDSNGVRLIHGEGDGLP